MFSFRGDFGSLYRKWDPPDPNYVPPPYVYPWDAVTDNKTYHKLLSRLEMELWVNNLFLPHEATIKNLGSPVAMKYWAYSVWPEANRVADLTAVLASFGFTPEDAKVQLLDHAHNIVMDVYYAGKGSIQHSIDYLDGEYRQGVERYKV